MKTKSLIALTITALSLLPVACTIETKKDDGTGGDGGAAEGGTNGTGGKTATGGKTSVAGSTSTAGGSGNAAGSTSVVSTGGAAGSVSVAGGTSVAGSSTTNVAGAPATGGKAAVAGAGSGTGGTTSVAGAPGTAGAAGAPVTVVRTVVNVTDNIAAATIWTADHIYVIPAGSTVYVSATLTIQPGTIVKFGSGARLYIETAGQLNAVGTAAAHIVFTGIKDDTAGGDTNADAAASQPSLGDWVSISVYGNSSSFDYTELRYSTAGIELEGASQSVKHSTLSSNVLALDATGTDSPAATIITDNVFYGNTYPISINGGTAVDATNVFHNPALATQINKFQAIQVTTDIDNTVTWSNVEVAYALAATAATYYLSPPAALTLASGVVVKVGTGSNITVLTGGSLVGVATATFTSYKDDAKLGDSNGDGTTTTAAAADWDGIRVITSTTDSWLTGAGILYATVHP